MNLYELSDEYQKQLDLIAEREADGELVSNDEYMQLLDLKQNTKQKILNTAGYIKNLEASSEAIKAEIDRLADRKKSFDAQVKRNKERLVYVMNMLNLAGIKGDLFTVSRVANSKPSVIISNESLIPPEYYLVKTVKQLDKTKLAKDYAQSPIEGVELVQGEHVRIG